VAWVRDGGAPDEVKVSFVVSKADHPELVEWLWGLPFRKQSSVIRDVLSEAAKMVSSQADPARSTVTGKQTQQDTPLASAKVVPAVVASSGVLQSGTSMTEATANIIRNMNRDF
jgi:hypothetical protein